MQLMLQVSYYLNMTIAKLLLLLLLLATNITPSGVADNIICSSGNNNVNERTEVFPPGVKQLGK